MTCSENAQPEQQANAWIKGDYDLRCLDMDSVFALNPMRDICVEAANRASRKFDNAFPGWQLYCAIVRQDNLFDVELKEWAVKLAYGIAGAHRTRGKTYIRPSQIGEWVGNIGLDALDSTLYGIMPNMSARSEEIGIDRRIYAKVYKPLVGGMRAGLIAYRAELQVQFQRVSRKFRSYATSSKSHVIMGWKTWELADGCTVTQSARDSYDSSSDDDSEPNHPSTKPFDYWRPTQTDGEVANMAPASAAPHQDGDGYDGTLEGNQNLPD